MICHPSYSAHIVMRLSKFLLFILIIVTSQSCVYRIDIPQGNRVDADKLEQLEIGMTRRQVEFLLGKAAINDPYHADKAYYVYYLYKGEEQQSEQKTMTLTYDKDTLVDIEGSL
jgi:outer membrane protein assembly factor BamE